MKARATPLPLLYVMAPEITLLPDSVADERPPAVAAATAALARAMGEEHPDIAVAEAGSYTRPLLSST